MGPQELIALGIGIAALFLIAGIARLLGGQTISYGQWLLVVGVSAVVSAALTIAALTTIAPGKNNTAPNFEKFDEPSLEFPFVPDDVAAVKTEALMGSLVVAMEEYAMSDINGRFPAGDDDEFEFTATLVERLEARGYYEFRDDQLGKHPADGRAVVVDGWGRPLKYRSWRGKENRDGAHNPNSYDLWSAGADGEFGTDDDIKNWH